MKKLFYLLIIMTALSTALMADENPFFKPFDTEHGTPPFDKIKIEHFEPAFDEAIKQHNQEVDAIIANTEAPTFENTILVLEHSGEMMSRVASVFFNLSSTESNDEMMMISQRLSPKLSTHSNNINLNEDLFDKIKSVYDVRNNSGLNNEQIRLVEKYYEQFENSGAALSALDKESKR